MGGASKVGTAAALKEPSPSKEREMRGYTDEQTKEHVQSREGNRCPEKEYPRGSSLVQCGQVSKELSGKATFNRPEWFNRNFSCDEQF